MLAGIPVVAVQGSGQGYKIADPRPVDHIWPHLTRTAGSGQRGSGHGSTRGQRGSNLNRANTTVSVFPKFSILLKCLNGQKMSGFNGI